MAEQKRYAARMRESDALSWYMERDPLLRSTVVSVLVFDRCPDPGLLREKAERASRLVPGLRHRIVETPFRLAPPRWSVDPDFDLSWHLRHIEAPAPKTLTAVLDFARITGMAGFDLARPLWEWTLAEGLRGGQAAVILKLHHALTDGIGGMQLAATLFDLEPGNSNRAPIPDAPVPEQLSTTGLLVDAVAYNVRRFRDLAVGRAKSVLRDVPTFCARPVDTARQALNVVQSIARTVRPVTDTRSDLMTARKLSWHYDLLEIPLDALKAAARVAGGTVNDAFVAGVAGGLRRYHEYHGHACDELRVTLPISIRHTGDPIGGNRITLMRMTIPVGITDPVKRMCAIHELTDEARCEPSIAYTNAIAGALNLLPPRMIGGMLKHVDFVASNVPGLPMPLYIGEARLERFYPLGPTIGAAVNVTLLSYRGTCCIGVTTDGGAVPDPEVLTECLRDDFEEILALAGQQISVGLPGRTP